MAPQENHHQDEPDASQSGINGNEAPLGEKAPGTPFALVALAYMTVLTLALLAFALLLSWWR